MWGVRLWELKTGKLLEKFDGHNDSVYSVSFSPDAKLLASGKPKANEPCIAQKEPCFHPPPHKNQCLLARRQAARV